MENQDWEVHKQAIRRLYCTEKKSLVEVMKFMKIAHNFCGSYVHLESSCYISDNFQEMAI
jgi:3'-phosphoadenosine 5'-phosphosulfate (PAPS) 3'-phosphatase